jgi:hypothetical protein
VAQQIRGTAGQERAMQMAGTATTGIGMVTGAKPAWLTVEAILGWMDQVAADGVASRSLAVQLHRNAVVRRFDVLVSAAGAEAVLLGTAAQVRGEKPDDRGRLTVVADFGQLTTVGSVGVLSEGGLRLMSAGEILIHEVRPWTGLAFADQTLFPGRPTERMAAGTSRAVFGEMRTERLQIEVSGADSVEEVAAGLWVELPDPPADLVIRIDGGPPVWSSPGPVRPGQNRWSAAGTQTVELGPALAALTGDPDDDAQATFTLTLTSRTPGRLGLAVAPGGRDLRHLARVRPGGADSVDVGFELEGVRRVPLPLPAWATGVERVALTATATLGPERAVPPVGPALATSLGAGGPAQAGGAADLVLDPDRSACARLPAVPGLAELVALRLPLRPGPAGAEVRVVLLAAKADGEPGEPLEGGASAPVTLDPPPSAAAAGAAESWSTFTFPAAVALEGAAPWAALQVARGQAAWPLGLPGGPVLADGPPIRRGPPTGPWQLLPRVVRDTPGVGGRLRLVGHAAKETPMAPLAVQVEGRTPLPAADPQAVRVTPTPRGVPVEWAAGGTLEPRAAGSARSIDLVVTSHVPGTVTLRDVVVTATRQGA